MISTLLIWLAGTIEVPRWLSLLGALALFGYFCVFLLVVYLWATSKLVQNDEGNDE